MVIEIFLDHKHLRKFTKTNLNVLEQILPNIKKGGRELFYISIAKTLFNPQNKTREFKLPIEEN